MAGNTYAYSILCRAWTALFVTCFVWCVSGCGSDDLLTAPKPGQETGDLSKLDELGGPWYVSWSCNMLDYGYNKYASLYRQATPKFANDCPADGKPQASFGLAERQPKFIAHQDKNAFSGVCFSRYQYLSTLETRLEQLNSYWLSKSCSPAAAKREEVKIIDYPACLQGCLNGDRQCYTCQARFRENKGLFIGDTKGHITCQTEGDARNAVKEWCAFVGTDKACTDKQIECSVAGVEKQLPSISGTTQIEKISHNASIDMFVFAKVEGNIPGVAKAEGRAGVKIGTELDFDISIQGLGQNPWVERYGRKEGNSNSIFSCGLKIASYAAVAADGRVEVGLSVAGNGAGGGLAIDAEGRVTNAYLGETLWLKSAGLSKEQMKGRCVRWAKEFLKIQIENSGVIRALDKFNESLDGKTVTLDGKHLTCSFPKKNESYRITRVWITFGKEHTTIQYERYYKWWFDLNSEKYQMKNRHLAPFKDAILKGDLSRSELVNLFNDSLKPHTLGTWAIGKCR